jgi:Uma2 family endonuclease
MISLQAYLSTTYKADREYVDGQILERNWGETDHAALQALLASWFFTQRKQLGMHVLTEIRTQVAATRFRIPDIAVTLDKPSARILKTPPFLCVEILSPEDRSSRMEEKIDDYLNFGVPHIWLIDPRKRSAWSYTQAGKRESVDVLVTSQPKIQLLIQDLFAELDEEVEPE